MSAGQRGRFHAYKDKGLTGLANTGNSCYLNTCMQVLSHTYELNQFLDSGSYRGRLNKKPETVLLLEWDKLRRMMWESNCTIAPYGFVGAVQRVAHLKNRPLFAGNEQSDAQEFMLFVIECLHISLAREVDMTIRGEPLNDRDQLAQTCYEMMQRMYRTEYSEVLGMFYGIHVAQVCAMDDGRTLSLSPEPFSVLSLSIRARDGGDLGTLGEAFAEYCRPEELTGREQYETNLGRKVDATRRILFWSLPSVLMVDLKRWGAQGRKLRSAVEIPVEKLDLSQYVKGYGASSYVYQLYGVCNHSGTAAGGHYTAGVRVASGEWYEFNDTVVRRRPQREVIGPQSYCLFYRKKK
jgi:ubiquitin carboxyl-terminal hydrolase 2/21